MSSRRIRRAAALAGSFALLAALLVGCHSQPKAVGGKPSIVLILTDDQRWDTLSAMENVQKDLVRHGVEFVNAFVSDPLCCPSRATILTGQNPGSTGVWQNKPPFGGFTAFHQDHSTIATWLHAAGYTTGLFGKYLNRYMGTTYIPPGWDRWVAIDGSLDPYNLYFHYTLNIDGKLKSYGGQPGDYSTDVLAAQAVSFIKDTTGPIFEYFAPFGPHTPSIPDAGDDTAFPDLAPYRPPNFNQADVAGEPQWVRRLPLLSPVQIQAVDKLRRRMLQSLQAEDRAVGDIVQALKDTGRLANTLIVFMSDNGFSWGEHRWVNKIAPYEEDIRVPMVVRFDRLVPGARRDQHLLVNTDLAPTFAALGAAASPGAEGASFLPLLSSPGAPWRSDFLIEHMNLAGIPSYCGVRGERYVYVRYSGGEVELYDLASDGYELHNLAGQPAVRQVQAEMEARRKALCRPPPPTAAVTGPAEG